MRFLFVFRYLTSLFAQLFLFCSTAPMEAWSSYPAILSVHFDVAIVIFVSLLFCLLCSMFFVGIFPLCFLLPSFCFVFVRELFRVLRVVIYLSSVLSLLQLPLLPTLTLATTMNQLTNERTNQPIYFLFAPRWWWFCSMFVFRHSLLLSVFLTFHFAAHFNTQTRWLIPKKNEKTADLALCIAFFLAQLYWASTAGLCKRGTATQTATLHALTPMFDWELRFAGVRFSLETQPPHLEMTHNTGFFGRCHSSALPASP